MRELLKIIQNVCNLSSHSKQFIFGPNILKFLICMFECFFIIWSLLIWITAYKKFKVRELLFEETNIFGVSQGIILGPVLFLICGYLTVGAFLYISSSNFLWNYWLWEISQRIKIIFDFSDLNFKRGDIILLKKRIDNHWYQGECAGNQGVFPLCYVQVSLLRQFS